MDHLRQQHVHSVFHYVPLHLSPVGQSLGYREGDLPITESVSGRLLRLPFYYEITRGEQEQVVDEIRGFLRGTARRRRAA